MAALIVVFLNLVKGFYLKGMITLVLWFIFWALVSAFLCYGYLTSYLNYGTSDNFDSANLCFFAEIICPLATYERFDKRRNALVPKERDILLMI